MLLITAIILAACLSACGGTKFYDTPLDACRAYGVENIETDLHTVDLENGYSIYIAILDADDGITRNGFFIMENGEDGYIFTGVSDYRDIEDDNGYYSVHNIILPDGKNLQYVLMKQDMLYSPNDEYRELEADFTGDNGEDYMFIYHFSEE